MKNCSIKNQGINIDVIETPVTQVLDQLLENTGITYKVLDNKFVVLKDHSEEASLADLQDIRVRRPV
jgi:hypothetical protein